MKKAFIKRLAVISATVVLATTSLVSPFTTGFAQYNDKKYDSYINMNQTDTSGHARYIIPNLYRQDAAYTNVKSFPLVVSDSVEYFPLDIFALYSYLEVVYSKVAYGFYINNTKNNHYVAFDLNTGITTNHDNQNLDLQAKIFHRTHYVPAKAVCEILGVKFETYDDPKNGVRAARISDSKAKYTLDELIVSYSPVKKDTQQEETPPEVVPDKPTPPPAVDDPYKNAGTRNIYLTFEGCPDGQNTGKILDVLDKHGASAIFFLEKDRILDYPDTVRQIVASGHAVGLYFSPQITDRVILSNGEIGEILTQTNNALGLVAKTKTRYIRAGYGFSEQLIANNFGVFAKENGYVAYDWNASSGDYNGNVNNSLTQLKKEISGNNSKATRNIYIRFGAYSATPEILDKLLDFCSKYPQFRVLTTDEYTDAPSFT